MLGGPEEHIGQKSLYYDAFQHCFSSELCVELGSSIVKSTPQPVMLRRETWSENLGPRHLLLVS